MFQTYGNPHVQLSCIKHGRLQQSYEKTKQNKNKTKQNKLKQNKTKQNKNKTTTRTETPNSYSLKQQTY